MTTFRHDYPPERKAVQFDEYVHVCLCVQAIFFLLKESSAEKHGPGPSGFVYLQLFIWRLKILGA